MEVDILRTKSDNPPRLDYNKRWNFWNKYLHPFLIFCLVVLSKIEAFFMDTKFNLSLWKSSSLLPAFSISLIVILGLTIFISSPINWMYIQKKSKKTNNGKFKITVSFKTLYTIAGAEFIIGGMIQGLIFYKGIHNELIFYEK